MGDNNGSKKRGLWAHEARSCPKLSEKKKNGKGKASKDKNDKQGNVAIPSVLVVMTAMRSDDRYSSSDVIRCESVLLLLPSALMLLISEWVDT
ncbi:hypothetical protein Droror1_Dr00019051 [Drosera rotundifolia]